MITLTGQLLLCDQPSRARLQPGVVRVDDQRITEVNVGEIACSADMGDEHTLISPGFIDAHLHLPQFDIIGAHGLPLLDWLNDVTFPTEVLWEDSDYARAMTDRVIKQCLSVGTTGICAYATVHHQSTVAALQQANQAGIRGVIGQVLMDRAAPDYLCRGRAELIDQASQTLDLFPPGKRVSAAVTPRFAVSCTADLLHEAGQLARSRQAMVQTHLAETERECETVSSLFEGKGYVDVYRDAGLLSSRTVLGHGIYLSHQDRVTLADLDCVIAHCPAANSFLQSGTMDRAGLVQDRVSIALGSDIGAGYERSMVRVARAMIEAAATIGHDIPSAAEGWYQITAGNADALNWPDAGRIAVGNAADLLVIQPDIPWLGSNVDSLAKLMWSWDDRWIVQQTSVRC